MSVGEDAALGAGPRRGLIVGVVSLLLATLFWAGNYVIGHVAVAEVDPLSLVLERWVLALVPLLLIAQLLERPDWRQVLRAWPWLLASSVFGLAGYNLLLYAALQYTTAFSASLVNAFNPALISIAAAVFLRQRLTPIGIIGIVAALIGVLVVLSGGDPSRLLGAGFGPGELLMIGAILAWTIYTVLGRRAPATPPVASTAVQAAMTVILLLPVSLAAGGPQLPATAEAVWALVFIAIFPSVLSYLLWNRALTVIPPARAGVFLNLITVFTALITILLGQPATPAQFVGGGIVLAGVALANSGAFRRAGIR